VGLRLGMGDGVGRRWVECWERARGQVKETCGRFCGSDRLGSSVSRLEAVRDGTYISRDGIRSLCEGSK
jgi:hypothetical protein